MIILFYSTVVKGRGGSVDKTFEPQSLVHQYKKNTETIMTVWDHYLCSLQPLKDGFQ